MAKKSKKKRVPKGKKGKEKARKPLALHKNRLFFGMFFVMVMVFSLSMWQQKYGTDLSGMATSPIQEELADYNLRQYEDMHTIDGEPCVTEINDEPYIHPDCLE
jgi:hypothetical protein